MLQILTGRHVRDAASKPSLVAFGQTRESGCVPWYTCVQRLACDCYRPQHSTRGNAYMPPRILVVNDTQEILDLFQELLTEEGYDVVLYSYGIEDLVEIETVQ